MALNETRDLRSGDVDQKRAKDHSHKWARGTRPGNGVRYSYSLDAWSGSETQQEKVRPERLPTGKHIPSSNYNKPKMNYYCEGCPGGPRSRSKINSMTEMRDASNMTRSLHELLPSPTTCAQRKTNASDDFIYSFDKAESPGKPLSLEIFVKTNTKATEKFVEKEYEILDYNGDAVKGRKALKDLHRGKAMAPPADEMAPIEEDGFELV